MRTVYALWLPGAQYNVRSGICKVPRENQPSFNLGTYRVLTEWTQERYTHINLMVLKYFLCSLSWCALSISNCYLAHKDQHYKGVQNKRILLVGVGQRMIVALLREDPLGLIPLLDHEHLQDGEHLALSLCIYFRARAMVDAPKSFVEWMREWWMDECLGLEGRGSM